MPKEMVAIPETLKKLVKKRQELLKTTQETEVKKLQTMFQLVWNSLDDGLAKSLDASKIDKATVKKLQAKFNKNMTGRVITSCAERTAQKVKNMMTYYGQLLDAEWTKLLKEFDW